MSEAQSVARATATVYARCPDCQVTLLVSAGELAQAGGVVACGECEKVFNALVNLFDQPPIPGQPPAAGSDEQQGMPPLLRPLATESDSPDDEDGDGAALATVEERVAAEATALPVSEGALALATEEALPQSEGLVLEQLGQRRSAQLPRAAWWLIALILSAGLAFQGQALWHYHQQLREIQRLSEQTREPEAFRIISRDVHLHPSVQSAQLISLRMLNTAEHPQPYPVLEVSLLDTTQNVVAVRRFHADEYLPAGADHQRLVGANEDFALVLQLGTPIGGNGGMTFRVL